MRKLILGSALILIGCGGGGEQGGGGGGQMAEAQGPRGEANVTGVVNFRGTPPANPAIDMSQEAVCAAAYNGKPTDPVVVVNNGKLANVFVYVKSGLPADAKYTAPSTQVVLDQHHCLYHPRVFGIMVGQPLDIRNNDSLLHNIKAMPHDNRPFNISEPTAGINVTRTFSTPEVMVPFECNVHGWMHAFGGVVSNPFYGVSGDDGTFTLERLPAGTYEIEAWHEKYGTQTKTVTVPATGNVSVEFTFGPTS